ncbi:hypothetical protein Celaphus_00006872 [Cervus elaphus hippelaphus]|uniref:Uncharacterized protein n=1 Tax=Cervus elaphus hippelaphus TaxID=46360 RepID=A0A212CZ01_CEREH|nr:hypothetical protein Celaphus_00006872 [Cervus elaphus hippelaphus]
MGFKDTNKTPMEPEVAIHWIRITLTSRNVKSLEKSLPSPVKLTPGLNVSSAPGPRPPREGGKAVTLKLRPSDAPTTPPMGGLAPLPAAAGSRGVPTATSNQRVEHRAAILARGHCACATRLKAASRGRRTRAGRRFRGRGLLRGEVGELRALRVRIRTECAFSVADAEKFTCEN